jgi:hypothetical protein
VDQTLTRPEGPAVPDHWLITLCLFAALFLALPWLAIAFKKYCDIVNRITRRKDR